MVAQVWEEVAVAATEPHTETQTATEPQPDTHRDAPVTHTGSVLLASLLLPGLAVLTGHAQAEIAPEATEVSIKYGHYQDRQGALGLQAPFDRVSVRAPQVRALIPIAGEWALEGTFVSDSVSGASPRLHTQRSGASVMSDHRHAGDVKLTRYWGRGALSASLTGSNEHDYRSRALGLEGRWATEDNNRTWSLGLGAANDDIGHHDRQDGTTWLGTRQTRELMVGVTQVLTAGDIVQFNLTRSVGSGYYDDPYKSFDQRPDHKRAWIALLRWNHHVEAANAALRTSWRIHRDTFGITSNTLGAEWVQPVGRWTLTPGLRYTTQNAARFYFDPVLNAQGDVDARATTLYGLRLQGERSGDQRLAAWGAVGVSLQAAYALDETSKIDFRVDSYRQTASLRWGGDGSAGLAPFKATFVQLGWTKRF